MTQETNFFDQQYSGGKATEVTRPEKSQTKRFLVEPISDAEVKMYGISKPRRIVIRGRIAK